MSSPSHQSDDILRAARQSLQIQQAGGRRLAPLGAQRIRRGHRLRRLRNAALAIGAVWIAASVIGAVIGGIGWEGLAIGILGSAAAAYILGTYPRMKLPVLADLNPAQGDVRTLVGRTELWLESQRRALPAPAVSLVDTIGLQLDVLGDQLAQVDQNHPKAQEVRKLVGEHLPGLVDGYQKIPQHLRHEASAGGSPDQRLVSGLTTISGEIDSLTRQLAAGAIDNLAINTRYLDYKYGAGMDTSGSGR